MDKELARSAAVQVEKKGDRVLSEVRRFRRLVKGNADLREVMRSGKIRGVLSGILLLDETREAFEEIAAGKHHDCVLRG